MEDIAGGRIGQRKGYKGDSCCAKIPDYEGKMAQGLYMSLTSRALPPPVPPGSPSTLQNQRHLMPTDDCF